MKIKTKHIFTFLMLFLIIFAISTQNNVKIGIETAQEDLKDRPYDLKQAGFWNNFTFIHITNLNWTIANETDWCSGSGTWDDPYLIENMIINASDSPIGCGILIENSVNAYFTIRNVTIFETTNGIKLENTNKGTLVNNILSNNIESGIYMVNCVNNTISGNVMNECGLSINGSLEELNSHNIDTSNLVNGKPLYYYTNEVNLGPNNFTNAGQVILVNCHDSVISNLNTSNGSNGISLYYCNNNTISGNTANYNSVGILLEYSNNTTISGNSASFNGHNGIYFSSNCLNNKIVGNTVKNNGVSFGDAGIYLADYCDDNEIMGNIISDNDNYGINIEDFCERNLIYNNTLKNVIANQQDYGIRLYNDCNQNNISLNTIENLNNFGIYIVTSDQNSVINNQIIDISTGMYILLAQQSEIISNTISGGSIAISLSACNGGEIIGNFINDTANYAIRLYTNCDDNEFYDNIIKDNSGIGIQLYTPLNDNNLFYRNSFISNGVHVFDNGTANFWNNTMVGNYWDNYSGVDLNWDNIGDTLFDIPGGANSNDSLPIVDHGPPSIIINNPTSSQYNATAPEFNIFVNETYIYSMWYSITNSTMKYYFTENGTIDQDAWNALKNGNVTITFYARDIAWNTDSASVDLIKNTALIPDGPNDPDDGSPPINVIFIVVISIIVIAAILIVGIVMKKLPNKDKIKKSRKLTEEQLSKAQYFKDVTSILTILAIHNDSGLCLSKIALHGGIGLDENLFTGFISAMGSFKNELAKQMGLRVQGEGGDNVIEYNEFTITLMDGEYLRLGLVSHSSLGVLVKEQCGQVLRAYEIKHVNELKNFDGELQVFNDFEEAIETGLDLNLNKKCIINVKQLNKYDAPESFITILNDLNSKSDGFLPAEITLTLVREMNISDQEANFMVYEAYKNQIFSPIKLEK